MSKALKSAIIGLTKEVTKEQIMDLVRPSELAPRDKEEYVFNPKIENILAIGKEAK